MEAACTMLLYHCFPLPASTFPLPASGNLHQQNIGAANASSSLVQTSLSGSEEARR
jgi:hypothetical protein